MIDVLDVAGEPPFPRVPRMISVALMFSGSLQHMSNCQAARGSVLSPVRCHVWARNAFHSIVNGLKEGGMRKTYQCFSWGTVPGVECAQLRCERCEEKCWD
jgi:hypothetical protein